jgi:hypothetical protein
MNAVSTATPECLLSARLMAMREDEQFFLIQSLSSKLPFETFTLFIVGVQLQLKDERKTPALFQCARRSLVFAVPRDTRNFCEIAVRNSRAGTRLPDKGASRGTPVKT